MIVLFIILAVLVTCLAVRWLATKTVVPWPWFLSWVLENPYMRVFANSREIALTSLCKSGMRVADLGCGSGRITSFLARNVGSSGRVTAVDMQSAMLRSAKKRMGLQREKNVIFIHANLYELEFAEKSFDRVLLVTVLGENPHPEALVKKIALWLDIGGILCITEVLPDPCYLRQSTVTKWCLAAGLKPFDSTHNLVAYTALFIKSESP